MERYHQPRDVFVAGFIGSPKMNLLPGELTEIAGESASVRLAGGASVVVLVDATRAQPGDRVTLGIRPEHVSLPAQAEGVIRGEVAVLEHLGDQSLVHLQWAGGEQPFTARVPEAGALRVGDSVKVDFPPAHCHLFDAAGAAFPRQAPAPKSC